MCVGGVPSAGLPGEEQRFITRLGGGGCEGIISEAGTHSLHETLGAAGRLTDQEDCSTQKVGALRIRRLCSATELKRWTRHA